MAFDHASGSFTVSAFWLEPNPDVAIPILPIQKALLRDHHAGRPAPIHGFRLSAEFRNLLASPDADERARVLQMFGGPSHEALSRMISPTVMKLLSDANAKRNEWSGHGGAASEHELRGHLQYLSARLEELRDQVGTAWRELQCVRAGEARSREGQLHQTVELAMGRGTPFRQSELLVGKIMEWGELYLAADGCAQPLHLKHLIVLQQNPESTRFAAYFYNRLEGGRVRLVSYQYTDRSDVTDDFADVADAVRSLLD